MTRPTTLGIVARYPYGFFFNSVLFGAQAVARQHNANLLVVQGSPASIATSQLAHNQVDAWMLLTHIVGAEQLIAQAKPTVTVGAVLPGLACPAVVPDNRGGIETAIDHLFDHGHERIAFVGWTAIGDINERYEGYQAALAKRGIPLDPNRLVMTNGPFPEEGQRAAQQLIANGLPCTAIIVGTDLNAIGVMQGLQDAGYRIPEDIAVIGFDDIPQAQSSTPPLSTIRQSFDALGAQAARMLLESLNGQPPDASIIHTPVMFVQRRSCGCSALIQADELEARDWYRGPEWREQLARALVDVLLHPIAADTTSSPAQIWPEVTSLIAILSDTLDGAAQPNLSALQTVWSSDFALRANVESLHAALKLVEHVATIRAEVTGAGPNAGLAGLLDRMRLEAMRSYRRDQEGRIRYLERVVSHTHRISLLLLDENNPEAQQLNWLDATEIIWGCLGLWSDARDGKQADLVVEQTYSRIEGAAVLVGQRYRIADFPPLKLLPQSSAANGSATSLVLPLRGASKEWGFLVLSGTIVPAETQFAESATDNLVMWATQLAAMLERRELGASLRQSYENERVLASTVRELGAPIIPLMLGVLLIPLVGALDSARAQQVISAVLDGIGRHHATVVLLDLTAVPIVDTQVANALIQAARAAMLLGAQVILVGIRPEIAQSIVSLGIDLRQITSQPTLEVALQQLIARRK